jgi:serine/threonine protein kinase
VSLKKLGRYELVRVLGKGAMGIVYEGKDPNLDRRVAIKTVKVENLSEEAAAEYEHRFRTEARSAARLQHPNIVSVYDSDRDGDIAFLVMEYIQGDDLKHHLDKGIRYSLEQSLKMIRDLLSALDYAHKQGIVHRDIKPANLLIEPGGRVKLTDFGVARIQDSGEATRTQGSMVGTLKYMAPEQVQGQKIDSRADLFSVGVVLYQLLTDKRPFDGDNDFSIIHQIIGHNPPAPSTINSKLPTAIDAVVARALAKDRDERFGTARDFATALQSAIRRAEDVTVVPAANPFKKAEGPGTGSRAGHSGIGAVTSPSTVTQEVELVYWKDIKDSADPDEFEAFLDKFPAGIYADLARKRLRKLLAGNATTPDGTILSGMPAAPARVAVPDDEATRLRSGSRPLVIAPTPAADPVAPALASPPAEAPEDASGPVSDFPSTITMDGTRAPVEAPAPVVAPPIAPPVPAPAPVAAPSPIPVKAPEKTAAAGASGASAARTAAAVKPAAKKPPVAVLAGVGALLVVAIAGFFMMGRGTTTPARAPAASSPAVVASSPAESAAVPATAVAPTVAASTPPPTVAVASATARAASRPASRPAPKPRVVASSTTEPPRPAPAPSAQHPQETGRTAATPAIPPAAAANYAAVEVCRERVFLAREACLWDHCEKPGARSHPLCARWNEDKRLRENSKIGN